MSAMVTKYNIFYAATSTGEDFRVLQGHKKIVPLNQY